MGIALQRHFSMLTKFAHVESRLSGRKRQREVVFYAPVNLCDRRACSTSVAVGLEHLLEERAGLYALTQLKREPKDFRASIIAPATPFCFCTTQKHLIRKIAINSMIYEVIPIMLP